MLLLLFRVNYVEMETNPYLFTLIALSGFSLIAYTFRLIIKRIDRKGSVLSDVLLDIKAMKAQLSAVQPPKPFMKHAEDIFSDILHHDNAEDKEMDLLLEKLKRAPAEPMAQGDRTRIKELFEVRKVDMRRPPRERKVASIMGDMMDLVLDEAANPEPVADSTLVGTKIEKPPEPSLDASTT